MPEATIGELVSNGIVFLLAVMGLVERLSATLPVRPFANTSTSIRWCRCRLRPGGSSSPISAAASAAALATVCFDRPSTRRSWFPLKATASPRSRASLPPWTPGKSALSTSFAQPFAAKDHPAARTAQRRAWSWSRISQCGRARVQSRRHSGPRCGRCLPSRAHLEASAALRTASKSIVRGYAEAPTTISFGRFFECYALQVLVVDPLVLLCARRRRRP